MIFTSKKQVTCDKDLHKELTSVYLDYLLANNVDLKSGKEVSELFRYSLCRLLGLRTKEATNFIEKHYGLVQPCLVVVLNKHGVQKESEEYKQGVVESCVHTIEMTRLRANV